MGYQALTCGVSCWPGRCVDGVLCVGGGWAREASLSLCASAFLGRLLSPGNTPVSCSRVSPESRVRLTGQFHSVWFHGCLIPRGIGWGRRAPPPCCAPFSDFCRLLPASGDLKWSLGTPCRLPSFSRHLHRLPSESLTVWQLLGHLSAADSPTLGPSFNCLLACAQGAL